MFRDEDRNFLEDKGYRFSTYEQGDITLLVLQGYELPHGYTPQATDILIQIPCDYPDANLDMWWAFPHVVFTQTEAAPLQTQERQAFSGYTPDPERQWQRFSRHPNWRAGKDDLRTFLKLIADTMEREAGQLAA